MGLLNKICNICNNLNVSFIHQYREANKVAGWFATNALASLNSTGYIGQDLPVTVRKLAYQEKIQTPNVRYG